MNIKTKAALTTLALNIILTILKFVLYAFSGSLAVLAEAWHSFSDIATSFLVLIAVRDQKNPASGDRKRHISFEQIVSIGIGLLLLIVAIFLMVKFFSTVVVPVRNPLIAGLVFILFSLGSYLVYRFETSVGREQNSVGLISDGMHARTDMMASLLTGFSLILYHVGVDIDRWVAGLIALVVLSFAIETIVNVSISIVHRKGESLFRYKTHAILAQAFSPKSLALAGEFLDRHLHIRFFGSTFMRLAPRYVLILACAGLTIYWASTCAFTVLPSEEAVVERFGEPLSPETPLGPGLHFKAPWPVDRAIIVDTRKIRSMNIGNTPAPQTFALLWTRAHGAANPFISGENDYFYPYLVLHYRVNNLADFIYRQKNPERTLEGMANQITSKIFATLSFYQIALGFRDRMVDELAAKLQSTLDDLRVGVEIINVAVIDIHPPMNIADAYELVIASYQEKERMINEALGYRNQNLPEARGEAVRTRKDAEGYAIEKPLRAKGDAQKFMARIPNDPATRGITQKRLWLAAMMETLLGRNMVIVDPKTGEPELWLNLESILQSPGFDLKQAEF